MNRNHRAPRALALAIVLAAAFPLVALQAQAQDALSQFRSRVNHIVVIYQEKLEL